jgi:hypothetical protein
MNLWPGAFCRRSGPTSPPSTHGWRRGPRALALHARPCSRASLHCRCAICRPPPRLTTTRGPHGGTEVAERTARWRGGSHTRTHMYGRAHDADAGRSVLHSAAIFMLHFCLDGTLLAARRPTGPSASGSGPPFFQKENPCINAQTQCGLAHREDLRRRRSTPTPRKLLFPPCMAARLGCGPLTSMWPPRPTPHGLIFPRFIPQRVRPPPETLMHMI